MSCVGLFLVLLLGGPAEANDSYSYADDFSTDKAETDS
jgi:hypothetical protein